MFSNSISRDQIKREPLPSRVAARLRHDIFTGRLKSGDRLTPERDIAASLGISRVTVRQALQELALEGWIEIVQGRGATVLDFRTRIGLDALPSLLASSPRDVVSPETFLTMHDFSNWLYEQICVSAARNACPDDEMKLSRIIEGYSNGISALDYYRIESDFYHELLRIGDNIFLYMFFNTYSRTFLYLVETGTLPMPPLPEELFIRFHKDLIRAVCGNRPDQVGVVIKKFRPEIHSSLCEKLKMIGIDVDAPENHRHGRR